MRVVVGRVGRAHGIRGEVAVEVRTDEPEERFAVGAELSLADDQPPGWLVVASRRWHSGRLLVCFEGVMDRTAAEALRGRLLEREVDPAESPGEPDTFYDRQLVGLSAVGPDGRALGTVSEVVHLPGQDLLVVTREAVEPHDEPVLVPFVSAIVPEVDLAGGRVVITPPSGLFPEVPVGEVPVAEVPVPEDPVAEVPFEARGSADDAGGGVGA